MSTVCIVPSIWSRMYGMCNILFYGFSISERRNRNTWLFAGNPTMQTTIPNNNRPKKEQTTQNEKQIRA